jgi:hypothetical protein
MSWTRPSRDNRYELDKAQQRQIYELDKAQQRQEI